MLQVPFIRENTQEVIKRLSKKLFNGEKVIPQIVELDDKRKSLQHELDDTLNASNRLAKEIGQLYQNGKRDEAEVMKGKTSKLKETAKTLEDQLKDMEHKIRTLLETVPNLPCHMVPEGKTPEDNVVVSEHQKSISLGQKPLPHWELANKYDIIDFELGTKITGAGFPVYKGKGARLQRALINFFLEEAISAGYYEIQPPILVNEASGFGTGQLPDKEGQMYHIGMDNLYVIPTAEVPITNIYRNTMLKEGDFPIKNVGYTPCFRREAGSYGKDVRGLNRLHQFDKVEIVQIAHPEKSYKVLEEMRAYIESLLQKLELPYRVLNLCGGDISFTAALTYDMEVFSAAQERWLEVSSVSNFEAYQANRLKLRFKDSNGQRHLAHTLNGSALALPRIVAALLENNQSDAGITIPEVLRPYTGFEKID